jgi:hypothetical protein
MCYRWPAVWEKCAGAAASNTYQNNRYNENLTQSAKLLHSIVSENVAIARVIAGTSGFRDPRVPTFGQYTPLSLIPTDGLFVTVGFLSIRKSG